MFIFCSLRVYAWRTPCLSTWFTLHSKTSLRFFTTLHFKRPDKKRNENKTMPCWCCYVILQTFWNCTILRTLSYPAISERTTPHYLLHHLFSDIYCIYYILYIHTLYKSIHVFFSRQHPFITCTSHKLQKPTKNGGKHATLDSDPWRMPAMHRATLQEKQQVEEASLGKIP